MVFHLCNGREPTLILSHESADEGRRKVLCVFKVGCQLNARTLVNDIWAC